MASRPRYETCRRSSNPRHRCQGQPQHERCRQSQESPIEPSLPTRWVAYHRLLLVAWCRRQSAVKSNKANIEAKSGVGITFHYAHTERGEAECRLEGGDGKKSRLQCGGPGLAGEKAPGKSRLTVRLILLRSIVCSCSLSQERSSLWIASRLLHETCCRLVF